MRRNRIFRKSIAIILVLILFLSIKPVPVSAAVLPSSYSSVEKGFVTSVKDQNPWGTCWSFSAIACMESYAISHGYANNTLDLSEYALVQLTYNDFGFESMTGDYTQFKEGLSFADCLQSGGNYSVAFKTLNKWAGVYQEHEAPYDRNASDGATMHDLSGKKPTFYLTGMTLLNLSDLEAVKNAIMENGAVGASCNSSSAYEKDGDGISSYYVYNYENAIYNHAITLVGWDDNIPATRFSINGHTPSVNGGWLVKNSWGTSHGKGGYQWISYQDVALLASTGVVYRVAPSGAYDYNYQHDGATQMSGATLSSESFANVFTVPAEVAEHKLKAVAFGIHAMNRNYSIQIYSLNAFGDNPLNGTPLLSTPVTGSTGAEGYYTVPLPETVSVTAGTCFAVVINFDQKTPIWCSTGNWQVGTAGVTTCTRMDGQSFYGNAAGLRGYNSTKYNSNFCLKAFAVNPALDNVRSDVVIVPSQTVDPVQTTPVQEPAKVPEPAPAPAPSQPAEPETPSEESEPEASSEENKPEFLTGDVNNDGAVDLLDLVILKRRTLLNAKGVNTRDMGNYDVDNDGDVDMDDYIFLRSRIMKNFEMTGAH